MQNGRPLSPRAQAASAHNEAGSTRSEPGRSLANVENSTTKQPTNENTRNQEWQTNFNDPMCTINLPQISRSVRPDTSVITSQPHSSRRQRTLQPEENENSLTRHPRLTSDIPPIVPPRPESTLTSKSRLTTMSTARINPSQHRLSSTSQSSGPGRGTVGGGGTLISQSQSVNLPNVSPPPVPITSNMSNLTSSNTSSNANITASQSQIALSGLAHAPVNISLISPRPGPDRVQNLYVDAPLKPGVISNNQHHVELSTSRTVEPVSRSNRDSITIVDSSTIRSLSSINSTSHSSSSVTLPKCRKGHLKDQSDTLTSIHRSKNTTTSLNCNSHHHRAHHHHHSHHSHQQKSQALSSKLSNHSVIRQQPSNHLLLQSSPSTLDSTCSTLKKKINSAEEDSRISPSLSSDMCRKCCKFQHSGTSGAITNHLLCPNHNSSISSSMSENQEHHQSSNIRFNLISTFESPLPRPTSTLPSLPLNSAIRIDQSDSIICRECGRCRCEACRAPRKLPEYWLCGNACVCSSETVVDTLSCMCCVKTMFYHCGKDCYFDESTVEDSTNAFDRPCSCTGEHACARWSFMGVLGMVLPCLWCYLPLKGCAKATQSVYQRCTATGCRCSDASQNREAHSGNMAPIVPPKMSEKFVGGKGVPTPTPKTSSSGFVSNNSISDNSSSLTSSPTIPSLSSPADSEKRLLE